MTVLISHINEALKHRTFICKSMIVFEMFLLQNYSIIYESIILCYD